MGHGHHHHERRRSRQGMRRRLRYALILTGTIFAAEVVGGWLSGSLALLSDAFHMLSDVGALLVSSFALLIAQRPADPRRSYGYYRSEILAAVANALVLMLLTGFIAYEAVARLLHPRAVLAGPMIAVALVGLAANAGSYFLLRSERDNLNVRAALLHVLGDLVSSVGVVVAGVVILATGKTVLDPLVSLFIAGLIVWSAVQILREAVDILLEATPAGIDASSVAAAMASVDGVAEVHDLHIWSITSGMAALSGHVIVPAARIPEVHRILDDLKHVLLERFSIDHTTIQIEPEGYEHAGEVHAGHAHVHDRR